MREGADPWDKVVLVSGRTALQLDLPRLHHPRQGTRGEGGL